MTPIPDSLRAREKEFSDQLGSLLRETAYENRYVMHPRRLAEVGNDLAARFFHYLEEPGGEDPLVVGQELSRCGLGDRTVIKVAIQLERFCRAIAAAENAPAGETVFSRTDSFVLGILGGYMKFREAQILSDQEQLRRALATALESQSHELLVKNHAINTSINAIILADLEGKVTWVNTSFLQMWGYASASEAVGLDIGSLWVGEEAQGIVRLLPITGGWRG